MSGAAGPFAPSHPPTPHPFEVSDDLDIELDDPQGLALTRKAIAALCEILGIALGPTSLGG
jgi:hypothetical protein